MQSPWRDDRPSCIKEIVYIYIILASFNPLEWATKVYGMLLKSFEVHETSELIEIAFIIE